MANTYLVSLAQEYLDTIDAPRSGQVAFHDFDHYASERSVLHEQLLQSLNHTREDGFDVEAWARETIRNV